MHRLLELLHELLMLLHCAMFARGFPFGPAQVDCDWSSLQNTLRLLANRRRSAGLTMACDIVLPRGKTVASGLAQRQTAGSPPHTHPDRPVGVPCLYRSLSSKNQKGFFMATLTTIVCVAVERCSAVRDDVNGFLGDARLRLPRRPLIGSSNARHWPPMYERPVGEHSCNGPPTSSTVRRSHARVSRPLPQYRCVHRLR